MIIYYLDQVRQRYKTIKQKKDKTIKIMVKKAEADPRKKPSL